jgi:hypothetical protein
MKTTPHMFVIAKDGTLAYDGAIDNKPDPFHDPRTAKNYVQEAVDELIAGKPVGSFADEALRLRREIRGLIGADIRATGSTISFFLSAD